jgi:hypothetical protein
MSRLSVIEDSASKSGLSFAGRILRVAMSKQPSERFAEVGSLYPLRENFRLTVEVKAKFTEKLRSNLAEFHGMKVATAVARTG